jgi:hypothetical protein
MTISSTILRTIMMEHLNRIRSFVQALPRQATSVSLLNMMPPIRFRLADVEYSFSEACQMAELVDENTADEALHLAAVMQFCGFHSVVTTMQRGSWQKVVGRI